MVIEYRQASNYIKKITKLEDIIKLAILVDKPFLIKKEIKCKLLVNYKLVVSTLYLFLKICNFKFKFYILLIKFY